MTSPKLLADGQAQAIDSPDVELFELDATSLGGTIYRFTPTPLIGDPSHPATSSTVTWRGNPYPPVPMESSGWEVSANGNLPAPHIKVANVDLAFSAIAIAYDDLRGAILTRHRTLAKYLDGAPSADPDVEWTPHVFRIERKVEQNELYVEWELAPQFDLQGLKIPARPIIKDACVARYRYWDGSEFVYDQTEMTCPFDGSTNGNVMFDASGNVVTDPTQDIPGRRLSNCCKKRFPNQPLPTFAFPGVVTQ